MTLPISRDDLLRHLKRNVEVGKTPISTGLSRLSSVRQILSVLSDDEATDVSAINVDEILRRFLLQSKHNYSIASQVSYKSRLRSALDEVSAGGSKPSSGTDGGHLRATDRQDLVRRSHSIPIPLSEGHTVLVERLPFDLTQAEAKRIANVILAYAVVE